MLPGRRDAEGRAFVTSDPVDSATTYQGGIAVSPLGQIHVVPAPVSIQNKIVSQVTGEVWTLQGNSQIDYDTVPISIFKAASSQVSSPDSPQWTMPGDVDIRIQIQFPDWTPSGTTQVAAHGNSSPNFGFIFQLNATNGRLTFRRSLDGLTALTPTSPVDTDIPDGSVSWIRATYNATTGAIAYYKSDTNGSWIAVGSFASTGGVIFDSPSVMNLGPYAGTCNIYAFQLRDGIDGTIVSDLDVARDAVGLARFTNGFLTMPDGALVVDTANPVASYLEGLPRTIDGSLVTQADVSPTPASHYLGGLRVDSAGVFTSSSVPPAEPVVPS
jgi:hypothetical protein